MKSIIFSEEIPPHFCYAVDESVCQKCVDSFEVKVIVPSDYQDDQIELPYKRSTKRIFALFCASCDGGSVKPLLIIPRKIYEDKFLLGGYTDDKLEMFYQNKGFIEKEIFNYWFKKIYLVNLLKRRKQFDYQGKALLIFDGCTAYCETELEMLADGAGMI